MRNFLVLAACVFCLVHGMGTARAQEKEKAVTPAPAGLPASDAIRMLDVGGVAPDFSIKDAEGAPFRFADEKGRKAVLLFFWSIFCEPCRFEMPALQRMHVQHKDSGLDVVAVALDGAPLTGSILGFVKQEGYTFKVLVDELDPREMFKAADPYGVAGVPTYYLVDRAGKVAFAKAGRMKEGELEKAIRAVVKK